MSDEVDDVARLCGAPIIVVGLEASSVGVAGGEVGAVIVWSVGVDVASRFPRTDAPSSSLMFDKPKNTSALGSINIATTRINFDMD